MHQNKHGGSNLTELGRFKRVKISQKHENSDMLPVYVCSLRRQSQNCAPYEAAAAWKTE